MENMNTGLAVYVRRHTDSTASRVQSYQLAGPLKGTCSWKHNKLSISATAEFSVAEIPTTHMHLQISLANQMCGSHYWF